MWEDEQIITYRLQALEAFRRKVRRGDGHVRDRADELVQLERRLGGGDQGRGDGDGGRHGVVVLDIARGGDGVVCSVVVDSTGLVSRDPLDRDDVEESSSTLRCRLCCSSSRSRTTLRSSQSTPFDQVAWSRSSL